MNMKRTRAYRRYVRAKAIARKKRIVNAVYGGYWFKYDGQYSKGHIGCGCALCKYNKHYGIPLPYEAKDRAYVKEYLADCNYRL